MNSNKHEIMNMPAEDTHKDIITYENRNPTDAEKQMFFYAGLYKVKDSEGVTVYMPIYGFDKRLFPEEAHVEPNQLDHSMKITFWHSAETIDMEGTFDGRLINLVRERMEELGWQM